MTSVPDTITRDFGHLDNLARLRVEATTHEQGSRIVVEESYVVPIPERIMSVLEELIGDGQATVSVGKEFKTSENFTTAGSNCWVKLTCNQDTASIRKAREIATALATSFALNGRQQARYLLDLELGEDPQEPPPLQLYAEDTPELDEFIEEFATGLEATARPQKTPQTSEPPTKGKRRKEAGTAEPGRKQGPKLKLKGKPNFRK